MAELMLSGCTLTTDHHYVFPKGVEDGIDIQVAAAKRLGLRALLTRGSMNRSQRDGGLPPDNVVQDEDAILADSERLVARYHQAGDGAIIQIALAPCSPFSITTSLMRATAELAERLNVRMHTHLAETENENRYCLEIHRCRPLDYLEECGWLNGRTWRMACISTPTNSRASPAPERPSRIAPAATRRWCPALARSARWKRPASPLASASTARLRTILRI
jgi:8-oxoguanine deaminase